MQVQTPGSGLPATITPSTALRQINATPQLVMPATMVATILTSFPVPATGETWSGELQLNHTQELLTYLSKTPLKVGAVLNLEATGPQSFRILEPESQVQSPQQAATQALRDLLPQYQPEALPQMLSELATLAATTEDHIPMTLQQQAQAILPFIPEIDRNQRAEQLKTWIESMQVPIEHLLAKGALPQASSLPARLLQMRNLISVFPRPQHGQSPEKNASDPASTPNHPSTTRPPEQVLVYQIKKPPNNVRSVTPTALAPSEHGIPAEDTETMVLPELEQSAASQSTQQQESAPLPTHQQSTVAGNNMPMIEPQHASSISLATLLYNLEHHIGSFFVDQNVHRALEVLQQTTGQPPGILHHTVPMVAQNILFSAQIPFFFQQQPQSVFVQIGRESPDDAHSSSIRTPNELVWQINLEFRLASMGILLVRSHLSHFSLETDFWAEHQKTLQEVQAQIPILRQQLGQYGVQCTTVHMHLGLPEQDRTARPVRLVDTKA